MPDYQFSTQKTFYKVDKAEYTEPQPLQQSRGAESVDSGTGPRVPGAGSRGAGQPGLFENNGTENALARAVFKSDFKSPPLSLLVSGHGNTRPTRTHISEPRPCRGGPRPFGLQRGQKRCAAERRARLWPVWMGLRPPSTYERPFDPPALSSWRTRRTGWSDGDSATPPAHHRTCGFPHPAVEPGRLHFAGIPPAKP